MIYAIRTAQATCSNIVNAMNWETLPCMAALACDRAWHKTIAKKTLRRKQPEKCPHIDEDDLTFWALEFLFITGSFNIELTCLYRNSCGNFIIFCRAISVSVCSSVSVGCKNFKSSKIMLFLYILVGTKHCNCKCKSSSWQSRPSDYCKSRKVIPNISTRDEKSSGSNWLIYS